MIKFPCAFQASGWDYFNWNRRRLDSKVFFSGRNVGLLSAGPVNVLPLSTLAIHKKEVIDLHVIDDDISDCAN